MLESALTKDKAVLSHVKPCNVQLWIDSFDSFNGLLRNYHWVFSLSDIEGSLIYDYKKARWGERRVPNEQGLVAFTKVFCDPRGGALTAVGTNESAPHDSRGAPGPTLLFKTARFQKVPGVRLMFKVSPLTSTETATVNGPTNKVTAGVKGGGDIGVVKAEVSGGYEHGFPSGSSADQHTGNLRDITLDWMPK